MVEITALSLPDFTLTNFLSVIFVNNNAVISTTPSNFFFRNAFRLSYFFFKNLKNVILVIDPSTILNLLGWISRDWHSGWVFDDRPDIDGDPENGIFSISPPSLDFWGGYVSLLTKSSTMRFCALVFASSASSFRFTATRNVCSSTF